MSAAFLIAMTLFPAHPADAAADDASIPSIVGWYAFRTDTRGQKTTTSPCSRLSEKDVARVLSRRG